MLNVGDRAPSFSLASTSGHTRTLEDLRGKKVVLYFYPKDETPGCTVEACDFRDNMGRLSARGVVVLGVSKDTLASHHEFIANHALPFELLVDPDNTLARSYGAYGLKNRYGKMVEGTIRSTFLIDEQGVIAHVWSPVRVEGHVEAVFGVIEASGPAATATSRTKAVANTSPRASGRASGKSTKPAAQKAASKKAAAKKKPAKKK